MWKANTEPWYWGYAFQGAVVLGTAPILLPLIADKAGGGAQAGQLVAAFIVEFKPRGEWDGRIGWLQTFYGAGQALGLALAAYLQARPEVGLILS